MTRPLNLSVLNFTMTREEWRRIPMDERFWVVAGFVYDVIQQRPILRAVVHF